MKQEKGFCLPLPLLFATAAATVVTARAETPSPLRHHQVLTATEREDNVTVSGYMAVAVTANVMRK